MNKKIWLAVVAVLILLGVGGYFVLGSKKDSSNSSTQESSSSTEVASTKKSLNTSLDELAKLGENMQCSFTHTDQSTGSVSSGTVYVAGAKMRGEFRVQDATSGEIKSSMINDGTYAYTWIDSEKQGSKFKIPATGESTTAETGDSAQTNEPVNTDQSYEFNCDKWSVDESFFTPPADVEFTDLTAQQQQLQQSAQSNMELQRQTCEQITDPGAQQACYSALGE